MKSLKSCAETRSKTESIHWHPSVVTFFKHSPWHFWLLEDDKNALICLPENSIDGSDVFMDASISVFTGALVTRSIIIKKFIKQIVHISCPIIFTILHWKYFKLHRFANSELNTKFLILLFEWTSNVNKNYIEWKNLKIQLLKLDWMFNRRCKCSMQVLWMAP